MRPNLEFVPRFLRPPVANGSFFLFGPRGTGKSAWSIHQFPDALRVDLLQPDVAREYSARPERLREIVSGSPCRSVVVDEVQKVPELLSVVHGLIESDRDLQFILTGSSARKLRRGGVDLMAGRAIVRTMHPYMAAELGSRFDLSQALQVGMVPLVVEAGSPIDVLRAYAGLYVREEVQAEGLVRNVGQFSRFLESMSFAHAAPLNISNVARDCSVGRKTVEGYLTILEDLLLGFRIPVLDKRARRAVTTHAKFYYFDVGVFRSLRPAGPLDRPEEIEGAGLEGLVAQHLRAWIAYRGQRNELFHWRTRAGTEVDLVVYGEDGMYAIEVKNAARLRPDDFRGLRSFGDEYPESERIILYRGAESMKVDGIYCSPVMDFLCRLHPDQLLFRLI